MAWLQSSFTNHQLIGDNKTSNLRKGYKVGTLNQNTDPDKSDTPLLLDGPLLDFTAESTVNDSSAKKSVAETKKPGLLQNFASKPSFLSSNFFDRGTNIVKTKPLPDIHSPTQTTPGFSSKPKEGKNLLSFGKSDQSFGKKDQGFGKKDQSFGKKDQTPVDERADSDDEDSDDEWFSPHASRGYQKVKTGAD